MVLGSKGKLTNSSEFKLGDEDRPNIYSNDEDAGRKNVFAFLLGGVVIAGGLLSFLYYDSSNLQRYDELSMSSISRPAADLPPVPSIRVPTQQSDR